MSIKIVLDAMGSDDRPDPEVAAALQAADWPDIELFLVGDEGLLNEKVSQRGGSKPSLHILHAPQALDMSDHIAEARTKKDNSMRVGMDFVKSGQADAFVTAGNTGMAMYFGTKAFGPIPGVLRPCLCGVFPVKDGRALLLDIGANAECRPEFLLQFGQMGSIYSKLMLNTSQPRVGLLANGEEEGKGNELVKLANPLMRDGVPGFVGNIEPKEIYAGKVDVAVTDGFTGNVFLKSSEAVAKLLLNTIKTELLSSSRTKIGALLSKPAFSKVRKLLDPSEIGAAPLLGLDGLVFVGHGRSDAKAMLSAIQQAKFAVQSGLLPALRQEISIKQKEE
ncbi:MAG: phosphate acyltransferase PlsX [Anaerolineaceae bacterium]